MRDIHGIKSCSTSPPKKKKKNDRRESEETMDIDYLDINDEVEDMEIVEEKIDVTENLSLKMDIKITEKQKRLEEEERKRKEIKEQAGAELCQAQHSLS